MSNDNTHTATDIITYIGVPLAVLGVLPILYNTVVTLIAVSRIKRTLRRAQLTALTRGDVVNRVIEIELPRYAVAPWDRFQHRAQYWRLARGGPSAIPGGSWTAFNWRTSAIGLRTQRVEYADQLRQPQAEVAFDDLVCYLLDLGAAPEPHGWRLLRSTGLWAPVGCVLMRSPDGSLPALTVAPLTDSDGHLSLAVSWADEWTTRDCSDLPPYWVELPPWTGRPRGRAAAAAAAAPGVTGGGDAEAGEDKGAASEGQDTIDNDDSTSNSSWRVPHDPALRRKGTGVSSVDSTRRGVRGGAGPRPITCQISAEGLVTALALEERFQSSVQLDSLSVDHLRIVGGGAAGGMYGAGISSNSSGRTDGTWFASAATAFGTTSQTVLWSYRIPDALVRFANRPTVPCGVLVLLGVAAEDETPEWSTGGSGDESRRRMEELEAFARRGREQRAAQAVEARMPPAQREAAARDRLRREGEQRLQDVRDRQRDAAARREARLSEALQSPRWGAARVAAKNLAWLKERSRAAEAAAAALEEGEEEEGEGKDGGDEGLFFVDDQADLKQAVGMLLHRMVVERAFADRLCRLLDLWMAWADNGGMRKSDFQALEADKATFALATLVVALISDASSAIEGTLSMDLQECLRMWSKVRLG
ncbi:hypothetical protein RB595_002403 [Gaeumannomyces hyphopodioides]